MKFNCFRFVLKSPVRLNHLPNAAAFKEILYSFYKPILFIFLWFGIDIYPNTKRPYECLRTFMVAFNMFITILALFIEIDTLPFLKEISPKSLVQLCVTYSGFLLKFILFKKRKAISRVINLLIQSRTTRTTLLRIHKSKNLVVLTLTLILFCETLLLNSAVFGRPIKSYTAKGESMCVFILKKFGITLSNNSLYRVYLTEFLISMYHNVFVFGISTLLYCLLVWHLKKLMVSFLNEIKTSKYSYLKIFRSYNQLCCLVEEIDRTFRSLVLLVVLYVSHSLYIMMFIMQDGMSLSITNIAAVFKISFLTMHLYFIIYVAADVPDINIKLQHAILQMPHDSISSTDKLFLMMKTQQGLCMMMGSLIPIKRSLFPTLLGTIFTYCLLINSYPGQ